jgi:hypothetical protein
MGITKAEIKRRQDAEDAKNRIFFLYEFIQRAENGGSPVPNEANLGHGEPVYVVKKRELMEFMAGVKPMLVECAGRFKEVPPAAREALEIINRVLAEDQFVAPLRKLGTPKDEE